MIHTMNKFTSYNNTHDNILAMKFTEHNDRCVELVETASRVSVTWQNTLVHQDQNNFGHEIYHIQPYFGHEIDYT